MFIRYTDATGRQFNLETTSGGHVARDVWMREQAPMTDRAIASGLYMRPLTRREAVADMASTVVEYLIKVGRNEDAISVADVILKNYPRNGYIMVKRGTAYGHLIHSEFDAKYPEPSLIPAELQARYQLLMERNAADFAAAEALGWQPDN